MSTGTRRPSLTEEDLFLLRLLVEGLPMDAAARRMEISERTLRRRVKAICDRLDVRTPIAAAVWAAKRGLL